MGWLMQIDRDDEGAEDRLRGLQFGCGVEAS
jgi:hypothetical protein